ncbi:MAG: DUF1549 domain-containing protein [Phycisphaeraceae bacterium]|nr:DUF1549 domain-containing protein [Phycisphaeraceae bacterium]
MSTPRWRSGGAHGLRWCHTHKYDPITHTDYFAFAAIFNNTEDADRYPVESPVLPPQR